AGSTAAARAARRALEALGAPFRVLGQEVFVQASIGIAVAQDGATSAELLLRNADMAMYTAKGQGKGRFALFEPAMHAALLRRLELEAELRRALEEEQFTLVYQPAVSFQSGRVIGVEALLRWPHPIRGEIAPAEFIPLAEETGLIVRLGAWVLREACRQVEQWQQRFPGPTPLVLSVNLSARQLQHPGLVAEVADALADFPLAPGSLVLEITESVLMQSTDGVVATLEALKGLGVQIAIDDFGTGYSSLAYLRKFPVDIVKIDRSFVGAVGSGFKESALVKGIIDIAHALGLTTVAEGVERPEQVAELHALQCRLGQGYLFGRPAEAEAMDSLLAGGAGGAFGPKESVG
ncbi:MAG TPA: GGDEF domain-containing phosphodiesterase, partial [Symbiobacteriaceae bacterium]|nr:GGDEF domain-containing phosphodiesterase [Symbiobacteriaceae bacterium]